MTSSPLSTLLATRLDAVLGTTLAKHSTLLDVRPSQAAHPASALHPQDNAIRRAPDPAEDATARGARRAGAQINSQDRTTASNLARLDLPVSARAILSEPAKAILALLVSRPDASPAVRGAVPMLRLAAASTQMAAPGGLGTRAQASAPATPATLHALPQPGAASVRMPSADALPATAAFAGRTSKPSDTAAPAVRAPFMAPANTAGSSTPVMSALPAFSSPMAQALATALARSVGESGLFYESHLSQLAFGQRKPDSLLREPQAQLGAKPGGEASPSSPASTAGRAAPGAAPQAQAETGPLRAFEPLNASVSASGSPLPAIPGIHPDATAHVRQQLEVLANANFQWQGQAWEGTPMQWEIAEHPDAEPDAPATWSTRLTLELPRLGTVEARLSIAGSQLVLRLAAEQSAEALNAGVGVLRERLSGIGLMLTELAIRDSAAEPEQAS